MSLPSLAWYGTVERISQFFLKYQKLFGIASNADAKEEAKRFLVIGIPVSCGGQGAHASLEAYRKEAERLPQGKRGEYLRDLDTAFKDAAEYQCEKEED